jgi:hypothetical protein
MEKIQFSMNINAPKEKVWKTMLNEDTYRIWTDVFMPGSHYIGDWSKGSKMLFRAPGVGGMVSRIEENKPYEFISIKHLGELKDGKEDATSELVDEWSGAFENYTLRETNGKTTVQVDMDTTEEYVDMFQKMWPKALQKLKDLAERRNGLD